jgi:hypothetical protein
MLSLATNKLTQTQRHKETKKKEVGGSLENGNGGIPDFTISGSSQAYGKPKHGPYPISMKQTEF